MRTHHLGSKWMLTLYSRLYNRLGKLCKWAQPSGAWAGQPRRLWRHCVHARSKAAVWSVDSRHCGALDWSLKKIIFWRSVAHDPKGWQKLDRIENSVYKTIYTFIVWIFTTFRTAGCNTRKLHSLLYNVKCIRTFTGGLFADYQLSHWLVSNQVANGWTRRSCN